jgi:hypothetical protein
MSWVIVFDTLCTGFEPIRDGETNEPCTYATEAEAQAEIDLDPEFYADCWPAPIDEIGHKAIFHGRTSA